jgi:hypothetical protein
MKRSKKRILILFGLICYFTIFPVNSINAEPYEVEPITSFLSPDLLPGQNYTWIVQEWYQMDDWLNPYTDYVPKSGDNWTMTIIGDLTQITPKITDLESFGIHYDPQSIPKLSDYLEFNISGHTFDEVFGNPDLVEYNWLMLSKLFLIPQTVLDADGNMQNFSQFFYATLENLEVDVEVNISQGELSIGGSISGEYDAEYNITFDASLGLQNSFTYKKKSVKTSLTTGKIDLIIKQSEFDTNNSDDEEDGDDDENPPYEISSYPNLIGWSLVTVIVLVIVKRKKFINN